MTRTLTSDELTAFHEPGYGRVSEAFPTDAALRLQDEMWHELREDFGIVGEFPGYADSG